MKNQFLKSKPAVKKILAAATRQAAKKDSIENESRRREQARLESNDEIRTLIENGVETSLILDRCEKHLKTYSLAARACTPIQDSIRKQQVITEIITLLKSNKLEESIDKCEEQVTFRSDEKIIDLCEKQLIGKIKKLPKKNIKSSKLAKIYFNDYEKIVGYIIQNDGKMILLEDIAFRTIIMVQHTGYIGECMLRPNRQIPFVGNVKYLGEKVYTTAIGARQSVPNYQLLWCD